MTHRLTMPFRFHCISTIMIIIFGSLTGPAAHSQPELTAGSGFGYANNLYADSFTIGNSYLYNGLSIASTHFNKIKARIFYELTYFEYDTDNLINNFVHSPGIALFQTRRGSRLKWNLSAKGSIKDYADRLSTLDNARWSFEANGSYYVASGLLARVAYGGSLSTYTNYDVLDNAQHELKLEMTGTIISKTSLHLNIDYTRRSFSEGGSTYYWLDAGLKIAQSLNLKTGLSLSYINRFASNGSRPLSTFFIISGISPYWDSWTGRQAQLTVKRILPAAVVSTMNLAAANRKFTYDRQISEQLPWLEGKTSRTDKVYSAEIYLRRQFNLHFAYGNYIAISMAAGYTSSHSSDSYYTFDSYYTDLRLSYSVF